MAKWFKGKTCAYCGKEQSSDTADHVFAREFFPLAGRGNLPKVSACAACNSAKSALESYVLTVLPFGGHHPAASAMMSEVLPRRLRGNLKLHRELSDGRRDVQVQDRDGIRPSLALPIDSDRLVGLFCLITRGLVSHHWATLVPPEYAVRGGFFSPTGETYMKALFQLKPAGVAQNDLGDGLILYEGVQGVDDPHLSMWRYRLFGGLTLAGDPHVQGETASDLWVTTTAADGPNFFDL